MAEYDWAETKAREIVFGDFKGTMWEHLARALRDERDRAAQIAKKHTDHCRANGMEEGAAAAYCIGMEIREQEDG